MELNENSLIERAKKYAIKCHLGTCHEYDGKPYTIHLRSVVAIANQFGGLIPEGKYETVIAACWCHDVIEDTRQTYNDVAKATSVEVAEIVYALTNEKGKTRKERANEKYYAGLREVPYAAFIKVCDRIANVEYSKETSSSMFDKYKTENKDFKRQLYGFDTAQLFEHLDSIFNPL